MEIKGIFFKKVSAGRDRPFGGPRKVEISSTVTLQKVAKTSNKSFGDCFVVDFLFKTMYNPNLGEILVEGEVYLTGKDRDIAKKVKKDYRLKDPVRFRVMNAIATKCLRSLVVPLSEDMRFPPPVHFPVFGKPTGRESKGIKGKTMKKKGKEEARSYIR